MTVDYSLAASQMQRMDLTWFVVLPHKYGKMREAKLSSMYTRK